MPDEELNSPTPGGPGKVESPAGAAIPPDVEMENGSEPEAAPMQAVVEDDPQLLQNGYRPEPQVGLATDASPTVPTPATTAVTDADDAAVVPVAEPPPPGPDDGHATHRRLEFSARHVIAELRTVEEEVRRILDIRDSRRKRKLAGTQRWLELEDDILSWRFAGRFDEDILRRLQQLVARRHHLFRQLHFIAGTRQTWNT